MRLGEIIEELVEERGLDRSVLSSIICEGMLAAYMKKYPDLDLRVEYDTKTNQLITRIQKKIVSSVSDEDQEVSVRKAKSINKKAKVGESLWVPFDKTIGRIEILRAKQVIANRIRKIESQAIYDEFKPKEGVVVYGVIHKCERGGVVVKLQDTLAFLPKSLTIPGDKCIVGYPIRALLKEVLLEPRNDNQLILDRSSDLFLYKLFELEIPEVFEKLVEVKKIVRKPGYKAKVAVVSNDINIDPVGTCVGVGGARIKPILKEIAGEKIDVIGYSESPEIFVKSALKPAQVNKVEIENGRANVWVDDDQRSLAIGRMGQNISLASQLTGLEINLMQPDKEADLLKEEVQVDELEPKATLEEKEEVIEKE